MKSLLLLIYVIAIGFPVLFLQACPAKDVNRSRNSNNSNRAKPVTKEMAIKIARTHVLKDYDVSNYDLKVHDRGEYWGFEFVKPIDDPHSEGRGAVVEVNKIDGSIRGQYIGK